MPLPSIVSMSVPKPCSLQPFFPPYSKHSNWYVHHCHRHERNNNASAQSPHGKKSSIRHQGPENKEEGKEGGTPAKWAQGTAKKRQMPKLRLGAGRGRVSSRSAEAWLWGIWKLP